MRKISHVAVLECSSYYDLQTELAERISQYQDKGLEVEIQYSTSYQTPIACTHSALVLAYSHEPEVRMRL